MDLSKPQNVGVISVSVCPKTQNIEFLDISKEPSWTLGVSWVSPQKKKQQQPRTTFLFGIFQRWKALPPLPANPLTAQSGKHSGFAGGVWFTAGQVQLRWWKNGWKTDGKVPCHGVLPRKRTARPLKKWWFSRLIFCLKWCLFSGHHVQETASLPSATESNYKKALRLLVVVSKRKCLDVMKGRYPIARVEWFTSNKNIDLTKDRYCLLYITRISNSCRCLEYTSDSAWCTDI